jgi:hypothetical protein
MAVHVTASYARRKQRIARRTSAAHIGSSSGSRMGSHIS